MPAPVPEAAMVRLAKEIGRKVHERPMVWHWRDREVFLADGTGFRCPTRPKINSPSRRWSRKRRGRLSHHAAVALISLATGAVIDLAFGNAGKGTGEATLFREMLGTMSRGDVVVADRYYPSFSTVTC